jgi:hypothetical protein
MKKEQKLMRRTIWTIVALGIFVLFIITILILTQRDAASVYDHPGTCTILEKGWETLPGMIVDPATLPKYEQVPYFIFTVHASDGIDYRARGRGSQHAPLNGQEVLDQHTVGKTYSCWYNHEDPTQAVFTTKK